MYVRRVGELSGQLSKYVYPLSLNSISEVLKVSQHTVLAIHTLKYHGTFLSNTKSMEAKRVAIGTELKLKDKARRTKKLLERGREGTAPGKDLQAH